MLNGKLETYTNLFGMVVWLTPTSLANFLKFSSCGVIIEKGNEEFCSY